ncbi:hypothetical protein TVAG_292960 [Trichomonas vaginalis G3]|uniref:Uncharacterized protein n=1 Tax=Trichomonas vaginalis (strain ATCC PRA-98 / G3) TaxID=412133 RepID=A2EWY6_TRIV3|nr:hypothetical protein TVAGG3_0267860 [Trichomonas vaginalis G3]EAY02828.1 hypothetical protein TVAG_292960 [Trichomonas vaginalis G3]KAI5525637.1 hypothetical protein TVAGG3_0267860 [Trichomonas vaginalis G3]|eukprot:XP_001315051.1 hypothetical protein [Trichomonas vaginalis G3]
MDLQFTIAIYDPKEKVQHPKGSKLFKFRINSFVTQFLVFKGILAKEDITEKAGAIPKEITKLQGFQFNQDEIYLIPKFTTINGNKFLTTFGDLFYINSVVTICPKSDYAAAALNILRTIDGLKFLKPFSPDHIRFANISINNFGKKCKINKTGGYYTYFFDDVETAQTFDQMNFDMINDTELTVSEFFRVPGFIINAQKTPARTFGIKNIVKVENCYLIPPNEDIAKAKVYSAADITLNCSSIPPSMPSEVVRPVYEFCGPVIFISSNRAGHSVTFGTADGYLKACDLYGQKPDKTSSPRLSDSRPPKLTPPGDEKLGSKNSSRESSMGRFPPNGMNFEAGSGDSNPKFNPIDFSKPNTPPGMIPLGQAIETRNEPPFSPMKGGFGQMNDGPMRGGFGQPFDNGNNFGPMRGGFGQPIEENKFGPVRGGFGQPLDDGNKFGPVRGGFGQPIDDNNKFGPVRGGFGQPIDDNNKFGPVRGGFGQPIDDNNKFGPVRGGVGQPIDDSNKFGPVRGGFGQPIDDSNKFGPVRGGFGQPIDDSNKFGPVRGGFGQPIDDNNKFGPVRGGFGQPIDDSNKFGHVRGGFGQPIDDSNKFGPVRGGFGQPIDDSNKFGPVHGGFGHPIDDSNKFGPVRGGFGQPIDDSNKFGPVRGGFGQPIDEQSKGIPLNGGMKNLSNEDKLIDQPDNKDGDQQIPKSPHMPSLAQQIEEEDKNKNQQNTKPNPFGQQIEAPPEFREEDENQENISIKEAPIVQGLGNKLPINETPFGQAQNVPGLKGGPFQNSPRPLSAGADNSSSRSNKVEAFSPRSGMENPPSGMMTPKITTSAPEQIQPGQFSPRPGMEFPPGQFSPRPGMEVPPGIPVAADFSAVPPQRYSPRPGDGPKMMSGQFGMQEIEPGQFSPRPGDENFVFHPFGQGNFDGTGGFKRTPPFGMSPRGNPGFGGSPFMDDSSFSPFREGPFAGGGPFGNSGDFGLQRASFSGTPLQMHAPKLASIPSLTPVEGKGGFGKPPPLTNLSSKNTAQLDKSDTSSCIVVANLLGNITPSMLKQTLGVETVKYDEDLEPLCSSESMAYLIYTGENMDINDLETKINSTKNLFHSNRAMYTSAKDGVDSAVESIISESSSAKYVVAGIRPEFNAIQLKLFLKNASEVTEDQGLGTLNCPESKAFLVKFDGISTENWNSEIDSLPEKMFVETKLYEAVTGKLESAVNNIFKAMFSAQQKRVSRWIVAGLRSEVTPLEVKTNLPHTEAVIPSVLLQPLCQPPNVAYLVYVSAKSVDASSDIQNLPLFSKDPLFCEIQKGSIQNAIDTLLSKTASPSHKSKERNVDKSDNIRQKETNEDEENDDRYVKILISNLSPDVGDELLKEKLPSAVKFITDPSLDKLNRGIRHATIACFESKECKNELKSFCKCLFGKMHPKVVFMKNSAEDAVSKVLDFKQNQHNNWLSFPIEKINITKKDTYKDRESAVLALCPDITPQYIVIHPKTVYVDYINEDKCNRAASVINQ